MNILFIVGAPRSGTTLTRFLLANHREVHGLPETPWLCGGYKSVSYRHLHEHLLSDEKGPVQNLSVSEDFIHQTITDSVHAMFEEITRELPCRWLIIKTPDDASFVDFLKRIYPTAKFLHVQRDGRDVAISTLRAFAGGITPNHFQQGFGPVTLWNTLIRWRSFDQAITQSLASLPQARRFLLKYEDLVSHSETTLRSVFKWLDLEWDPDVLDYKKGTEKSALPDHEKGSVDVKTKSRIETSSVERWTQLIDESCFESLDTEFGEDLVHCGYLRCAAFLGREKDRTHILFRESPDSLHEAHIYARQIPYAQTLRGRIKESITDCYSIFKNRMTRPHYQEVERD
ncbi:MAG: sulfotransferase family protein [Verrucomicrobiales bacterium]